MIPQPVWKRKSRAGSTDPEERLSECEQLMNLIYRAIRKTAYLCSGPVAALGRRMLKMDRYVTEYGPEMADEFNYIVIFGAGLLWRTGEPSPVLRDRLDLALRVEAESGRAFLFVCSGECRGPE